MEIVAEGLGLNYGAVRALSGVTLTLRSGEVLGVLGPNGSGKSTLLKILAGILVPTEGSVTYDGSTRKDWDDRDLARRLAYLPQQLTPARITVLEAAILGRRPFIRWGVTPSDLAAVDRALAAVGIRHLASRSLYAVSGGERQKAFLARALAQDPEVFFLDEPTSALDIRHQLEVLGILWRHTRNRGSSVAVAMHDLNLAARYADRVLLLSGGVPVGCGAPWEVLTPERIGQVFGVEVEILPGSRGRYLAPFAPLDKPAAE
ncbi:MAG TPA: ABC transporter ATP-binding protein [Methanomicrobiales archaeon]|nr:ABC transporter ATP-binding protein [Methanomicrobiales archaeon]